MTTSMIKLKRASCKMMKRQYVMRRSRMKQRVARRIFLHTEGFLI